MLIANPQNSFCEFKGTAKYLDLAVGHRTSPAGAWTYPNPSPAYNAISGYIAFYASRVDACYVDEHLVTPQPGGFYGGWITPDVVGPFKGIPGSWGW